MAGVDLLTPRELECLRLLASGLTNMEIAARLGIGYTSVRSYVVRIYDKLGINSRAQAAVIACRMGLLEEDNGDVPRALRS